MSVSTLNAYGKITISDNAIATVAGNAAIDCYGVVELVGKKFTDSFYGLFKKNSASKGIRVLTHDNRINIDIYAVLKYGVTINAVAESLKKSVKYSVEQFTGMIVDSVSVNVIGIKI